MDASRVILEVVAPHSFYCNHHDKKDFFTQINTSLDEFAASKINGLSMSLDAFAFPEGFRIPFENGSEVKEKCDNSQLTEEGRLVRDAFDNLTQVWPAT